MERLHRAAGAQGGGGAERSDSAAAVSAALEATLVNAIQALGRGFDVNSDTRLLYCKGAPGSRLVQVNEGNTRDIRVSEGVVVQEVPVGIDVLPGKSGRETTGVLSFHHVRLCPTD